MRNEEQPWTGPVVYILNIDATEDWTGVNWSSSVASQLLDWFTTGSCLDWS
jgi:hypothetical protein